MPRSLARVSQVEGPVPGPEGAGSVGDIDESWVRVLRGLGLATWNARTLFGSLATRHCQCLAKWARVQGLIERCQIVCLQETHGSREDVFAFGASVRNSHVVFSSHCHTLFSGA